MQKEQSGLLRELVLGNIRDGATEPYIEDDVIPDEFTLRCATEDFVAEVGRKPTKQEWNDAMFDVTDPSLWEG